jgi:hypothetical protein
MQHTQSIIVLKFHTAFSKDNKKSESGNVRTAPFAIGQSGQVKMIGLNICRVIGGLWIQTKTIDNRRHKIANVG